MQNRTAKFGCRWAVPIVMTVVALPWSIAAAGQDIVVTAPALPPWRALLIADAGNRMHCRIMRSTGDDGRDATGCDAMMQCFETARPLLVAREGEASRVRRRRLASVNRDMQTCFQSVTVWVRGMTIGDWMARRPIVPVLGK